MKTIVKRLLIIFMTLFMVFAFGQSASALVGSEAGSGGEGGITVYPSAPGTKYEGPLTIYYVPAAAGGFVDMYFFLRLRKGSTWWGFSGSSTEPVLMSGTTDQQAQVEAFMNDTVMPILYPGYTPPTNGDMQTASHPWYLKSVDQLVTDVPPPPDPEAPDCCNGMLFVIMDVVVAVQD